MQSFQFTFEAIGTNWIIDIPYAPDTVSEKSVMETVTRRIDAFDKVYSRFRKDSLVTTIAESAGTYSLPEDAEPLFRIYKELYSITRGAFTPLIGTTLVQAGYDRTYSLKPQLLQYSPSWEEVINYEYPKLTVNRPVILDFGAAGKGLLVDMIGELLHEQGISSFTIDAGGDILHISSDEKILKIGLEHPDDQQLVIGVASLTNLSICGSAGNRRRWGIYHHIIDPGTLTSPEKVLATWVVADSTLVSDALATCLFLVEPETLIDHYEFEYLIVYPDYSIGKSSAFPAEIFYT